MIDWLASVLDEGQRHGVSDVALWGAGHVPPGWILPYPLLLGWLVAAGLVRLAELTWADPA